MGSKYIDKDKAIALVEAAPSKADALTALRRMSAADVAPVRRGRWVHHWDDHDDWLECSECGYGDEGEVMLNQRTNFCPHCGADMRKDGDYGKAD